MLLSLRSQAATLSPTSAPSSCRSLLAFLLAQEEDPLFSHPLLLLFTVSTEKSPLPSGTWRGDEGFTVRGPSYVEAKCGFHQGIHTNLVLGESSRPVVFKKPLKLRLLLHNKQAGVSHSRKEFYYTPEKNVN